MKKRQVEKWPIFIPAWIKSTRYPQNLPWKSIHFNSFFYNSFKSLAEIET